MRPWSGVVGAPPRLPPTNRGVEITPRSALSPEYLLEFAVHELTGTSKMTVRDVLEVFSSFDLNLKEAAGGSRMYRRRWVGEHGISLQAHNKMGSDEVHVRLTGTTCEHLGLVKVLSLAVCLGLNITRLDGAIDGCPFTPEDLFMAHHIGQTRTHAQAHRFYRSTDGDTFYLGSGKSDVQLRVYNRRGFTRSELQLRRGHAQNMFDKLMATDLQDYPALFLGALRSHVDFVDRKASTNINRAPLLPFWSNFVALCQKVKLAPARVQSGASKYLQHVIKCVFMVHVYGSLMARKGIPFSDALFGLYTIGSEKLKPHHRLLLERDWFEGETVWPGWIQRPQFPELPHSGTWASPKAGQGTSTEWCRVL